MPGNERLEAESPMWTGELENTAVIFFQGRNNTQAQVAKLVGGNNVGTTTGEIARSKRQGILTIPHEQVWLYPELNEINLHDKWALESRIKLWFRGIQVSRHEPPQQELGLYTHYPQDQQRGSVLSSSIMSKQASLGQSTDINDHQLKYDALTTTCPNITNIILYGISRGAATSFAALAKHKNEYQKVKLCVLEGPPASIRAEFKKWNLGFLYPVMCGGQHQSGREHQALNYAKDFPDHIPLVVISSQKDSVVHHTSSIKLALAVAAKRIAAVAENERVTPVYFLQLDKSGHNDYTTAGTNDPSRYQNAIHAIYREHQLPHITTYAQQGKDELNIADLANVPLRPIIKLQAEFKRNSRNKPRRQELREQAMNDITAILASIQKPEDKQRVVSICRAMPLFYKHQPAKTLFGKTNALKELTALSPPNQGKINSMLLFAMQHPKLIAGLVGLLIAAVIVASVFSCGVVTGVAIGLGTAMSLSGTSAFAVGTATGAVAIGLTAALPTFFSLKATAKAQRPTNDSFPPSEIAPAT